MSETRIVVTGGNGFIGTYCCAQLAKQGLNPISVGRRSRNLKTWQESFDWEHIPLDLSNLKSLTDLFLRVRPTHLLHLAWFVDHLNFWEGLENVDSMQMTLKLFSAFEAAGGKRFVGVGSCAEYDWSKSGPYREVSKINPASLYGKTKAQTYEMLNFMASRSPVSFAWARPFYIWGFGEPTGKLIPTLLRSYRADRPISLNSDPTLKDFVYVEDVARGLCMILMTDAQGPFNIGTGIGYSANQIVDVCKDLFPNTPQVTWEENSMVTQIKGPIVADLDIIKERVGWVPQFNLNQGLDRYLKMMAKKGIK